MILCFFPVIFHRLIDSHPASVLALTSARGETEAVSRGREMVPLHVLPGADDVLGVSCPPPTTGTSAGRSATGRHPHRALTASSVLTLASGDTNPKAL